jgi:hypothetical protein
VKCRRRAFLDVTRNRSIVAKHAQLKEIVSKVAAKANAKEIFLSLKGG